MADRRNPRPVRSGSRLCQGLYEKLAAARSFPKASFTIKGTTRGPCIFGSVPFFYAGEDVFGEFAAQAPPELRDVVANAAKMFHAMGLQAAAAGEAIREAATAFTGRKITRA
jgi:hypothetical protein